MRFTEHELTAALHGAGKSILATQDKDVRKGRRTVDQAWQEMDRYQRFKLLDGLGGHLLPVLVGLPDVAVATGERPTFTDDQVRAAVEEQLGDQKGIRRRALLEARVALVRIALASVPPRQDPDALVVPDHL
ncbi:hypothetical protein [Nocardioides dongxiaopingii]|uniref:hypothetical protein n=1 Tax=Nocardioides dongxiaopingii TaxID=2576036 RepID=UPI0010C76306|nr:hypothetical protein [Nocardioides dongxiaopingii]